eukprot:gene27572-18109_t
MILMRGFTVWAWVPRFRGAPFCNMQRASHLHLQRFNTIKQYLVAILYLLNANIPALRLPRGGCLRNKAGRDSSCRALTRLARAALQNIFAASPSHAPTNCELRAVIVHPDEGRHLLLPFNPWVKMSLAKGLGSKGAQKVYAVRKGRETGIFSTWAEVQKLVNGFPGAQHQSFE